MSTAVAIPCNIGTANKTMLAIDIVYSYSIYNGEKKSTLY